MSAGMTGPNLTRCEDFATAIDLLSSDDDNAVLALVAFSGLTYADFTELDELPGHFRINGRSYTDDGSEWHRRLRVVRNDPTNNLFDLLRRD